MRPAPLRSVHALRLALVLVVAASVVACDSRLPTDSTYYLMQQATAKPKTPAPPPAVPAWMRVTPDAVCLRVGAEYALAAAGADSTGRGLDPATMTWQSTQPAIATVNGAGLVRALAAGRAKVVVRSGRLADTSVVTVDPAPSGQPMTCG